MPVVFFGHGSPANALEDNEATRAWHHIAGSIQRPRAILSISAHWYTHGSAVTAMEKPETIHDFGGPFPAPLFDVQYPAPGDPGLARRVSELLAPVRVRMDQSWGLDHGTWSVLIKAYPEAEIPVVQLSLDLDRPLDGHYALGQRLRPLRREGILIMGSGNIVHNLALMDSSNPGASPFDWAVRFNDMIKDISWTITRKAFGNFNALDRTPCSRFPRQNICARCCILWAHVKIRTRSGLKRILSSINH